MASLRATSGHLLPLASLSNIKHKFRLRNQLPFDPIYILVLYEFTMPHPMVAIPYQVILHIAREPDSRFIVMSMFIPEK
jgi:hypothetical protein